jgi:hypothetical protein
VFSDETACGNPDVPNIAQSDPIAARQSNICGANTRKRLAAPNHLVGPFFVVYPKVYEDLLLRGVLPYYEAVHRRHEPSRHAVSIYSDRYSRTSLLHVFM